MPVPRIKLNDGNSIPAIGFGTGTAHYGRTGPDGVSSELVTTIKTALNVGFDHLGSAEMYGNEKSTGVAIVESGRTQESFFLTTKVLKGASDLRAALKRQLADLRVSYVDLYLLHSPRFVEREGYPSIPEAWRTMEALKGEGLARSIGVSNFRIKDLEELLPTAKTKPVLNQIELNPYVWKEAEPLLEYMNKHSIGLAAYGAQTAIVHFPGGPVDLVVERMAQRHSLTPGQVLIQWSRSKGGPVLTTSTKDWRMREQLEAITGPQSLTPEEVEELGRVGKSAGVKRQFMKHMSQS